jgi:hypothetical protein
MFLHSSSFSPSVSRKNSQGYLNALGALIVYFIRYRFSQMLILFILCSARVSMFLRRAQVYRSLLHTSRRI